MGKQIHTLTLEKEHPNHRFGFRIIGGKDEGQTFKVRTAWSFYKIPSNYTGLFAGGKSPDRSRRPLRRPQSSRFSCQCQRPRGFRDEPRQSRRSD